jgi:hypothetical protein
MIVFDSGYDLTRLAWLLRDLPVEVTGRLRSDRVMYFPAPPRPAGADGRPSRHGTAFRFDDQQSWPAPAVTTSTATQRYGNARACAWPRLHQKLARQRQWQDHPGPRPDPPQAPRPGRRRPVDLAHHRLLRPAVPRPPSRR